MVKPACAVDRVYRGRSPTASGPAPPGAGVHGRGAAEGSAEQLRMHHVGIVVTQIDGVGRSSAQQMGLRPLTQIYDDPVQKVKVQFWGSPTSGTCIELIEPSGPGSPVEAALAKGGGLNHICYEVDDLEAARADAVARGAVCVCPPVPAVAFGGRPIAFFFYRGLGLVELVQAPEP